MSGCWAIVSKNGQVAVRFDDPELTEKAVVRRNKAVWKLDREPQFHLGEAVSFDDGSITFSAAAAAAYMGPVIRAATHEAILRHVPLWRQVNDIEDPESEGKSKRRALINALRARSKELELAVANATNVNDVTGVLSDLQDIEAGRWPAGASVVA